MRAKPMIAVFALLSAGGAAASETTTYSYDAKGRLTAVYHSGGPNNGISSTYAFDRADNRTLTVTTGAWLDSGARPVVVTPLRAGSVIPLPGL